MTPRLLVMSDSAWVCAKAGPGVSAEVLIGLAESGLILGDVGLCRSASCLFRGQAVGRSNGISRLRQVRQRSTAPLPVPSSAEPDSARWGSHDVESGRLSGS